MSWNVKSALVNENLYAKHKTTYRTIPSHPELRGGRGTQTHKPLRTTVFEAANYLPDLIPPGPRARGQRAKRMEDGSVKEVLRVL